MTGVQTCALPISRGDWVEQAWAILQPVLDAWGAGGEPSPYEAGTWGPPEADEFIGRAGGTWHRP